MHTPERFRNVAVPANGLRGGEDLGELLGTYLVPFDRRMSVPQQGRRMIKTTQHPKTLVTIDAAPPQIPVRHDIPQEAVLGISYDLFETLLPAILALRPMCTSIQMKRTPAKKRARRCSSRCNIHRFCLQRIRTVHEPLATIKEVGVQHRDNAENNKAQSYGEKSENNKCGRRHKSPRSAMTDWASHSPRFSRRGRICAVREVTVFRDGDHSPGATIPTTVNGATPCALLMA